MVSTSLELRASSFCFNHKHLCPLRPSSSTTLALTPACPHDRAIPFPRPRESSQVVVVDSLAIAIQTTPS
jgi:hypothetical protein